MTTDRALHQKPTGRPTPQVVAPSTRVNVAFPLSRLVINQPDDEVRELVDLVAELTAVLAAQLTDPAFSEVDARAQDLAARFREKA